MQDDEFDVTLDDGTEDGAGPGSGYAPNRYVRPGAQVPAQAPIVGSGYRPPLQLPGSCLPPSPHLFLPDTAHEAASVLATLSPAPCRTRTSNCRCL